MKQVTSSRRVFSTSVCTAETLFKKHFNRVANLLCMSYTRGSVIRAWSNYCQYHKIPRIQVGIMLTSRGKRQRSRHKPFPWQERCAGPHARLLATSTKPAARHDSLILTWCVASAIRKAETIGAVLRACTFALGGHYQYLRVSGAHNFSTGDVALARSPPPF